MTSKLYLFVAKDSHGAVWFDTLPLPEINRFLVENPGYRMLELGSGKLSKRLSERILYSGYWGCRFYAIFELPTPANVIETKITILEEPKGDQTNA